MSVSIAAIIEGISAIPTAIAALRKLTHKERTEEEEAVLKDQVQEISNKINVLKDMGWSMDAYITLYGHALEIYTTADDLITVILKTKDVDVLIGEGYYYELIGKFDRGLALFVENLGKDVDAEDSGAIKENISQLNRLFGEGKVHIEADEYKKLERTVFKIAEIANKLRGRAYMRLIAIIKELERSSG